MKPVIRNKYMDDLYSLKNTPDIKIITGVRRCGKSFLMNMFIGKLRKKEPDSDNHKRNVINYLFVDEVKCAKILKLM